MAPSVPEADHDRKDENQAKGTHATMNRPPAVTRGRGTAAFRRLLLTPPARLGWTFRSRRELITPYTEPPPDPEAIRQEAAARLAVSQASWQRARKWGIRPSLIILIGLIALAACAHAINPASSSGTTIVTALALAGPGLGWAGWRYAQLNAARAADPRQHHQQAHQQWAARAAQHEQAELYRLAEVPEWGSAELSVPRTDVYGGTLAGWQSLITVHGASILAQRPLLVADLSGQYALSGLAALARDARVPAAEYLLPRDLDRFGLLVRLGPQQLADALAEAIHAGAPGTARTDRAVDVRVLSQICTVLGSGGITPARLAAATQAALGRPVRAGLLSAEEAGKIGGKLFGDSYQTQIGVNLVRLDAFLSDLALYDTGTTTAAPPPAAYCTFLALEPAARSARAELIAALVIQWLTVEVTASTRIAPAVIIAAADEITRNHLERLADACDRRQVPLTLLFRHLREESLGMIGGGATAFMRLGNHHEAEQAAAFIGRHHKFVLSGYTATSGGNSTLTRGEEHGYGTTQSRGYGGARGWAEDGHLGGTSHSGSRTRSRDFGRSENWSTSASQSDGADWSDATAYERVYEYAVEPAVLQNLPEGALLLTGRSGIGADLRSVEIDPAIITLPQASTHPLPAAPPQSAAAPRAGAPRDWPELEPRDFQPRWPQSPDQAQQPAWPPLPGQQPRWRDDLPSQQ